MFLKEATNVTRFGATGRQVLNDLTEGIEGKDVLTELVRIPRNIAWGAWHTLQGIIPMAADTVDAGLHGKFKRYNVESRENEAWAGTSNSIGKIGQSIREGRLAGILSTTLSEATDGPIDDLGRAITGAPNTVVRPVSLAA